MSITSQIDKIKDLTIFKVTEALTFDIALPVVKAFYDGDPTRHVLWDLTDIADTQFTSKEIDAIVRFEPRYEGKRELGKTAFVAQKDIIFGLSRMFEIQSGIQESPYPIKVFRSLYEAHQWLDES
jgi:hypothetical protein